MTVRAPRAVLPPAPPGRHAPRERPGATFEHVTAPGVPPDTELTLHVAIGPGRTLVDISATKLQHAPPEVGAVTDEQRWKKQGLSPSGRILNPMHLD